MLDSKLSQCRMNHNKQEGRYSQGHTSIRLLCSILIADGSSGACCLLCGAHISRGGLGALVSQQEVVRD